MLEECGPRPVFVSYTVVFALQLRKKHGKTSVSVAEECQFANFHVAEAVFLSVSLEMNNSPFRTPAQPTRIQRTPSG
jgi:hypothetical protein